MKIQEITTAIQKHNYFPKYSGLVFAFFLQIYYSGEYKNFDIYTL